MNGLENRTCTYTVYKRPTSPERLTQTKVKGWVKTVCANGNKQKGGVAIFILDKIDFKTKAIYNMRRRRTFHNDKGNNPTKDI